MKSEKEIAEFLLNKLSYAYCDNCKGSDSSNKDFCDDCKNDVEKLYQLVDGEKLCWGCLKKYLKEEWIDDIALLCKDEIIDYMDVIEIRQ